MHSIHNLVFDLTIITIYAGLTTLLFKKMKQPIVLGYLLAGILAGSFFDWTPTVKDSENITLWAEIGVIFLLFGLGLEFSFSKMVNVGKSAMITAAVNIVFMLFLGYNVGLLLGWSKIDSFFLGSMISMSSTTIIIKAFDDLNIKRQKFTDLVFGVLVVEDLVGILLLVILPMVSLGQNINGLELGLSTLRLMFFLVLCFIIGIYIVPTFLKKFEKYLNDEILLLITLSMCFGMVLFATSSGFSSALGAFLMGSILSETVLIHRIEKVLQPLKDFFGAVFFVSVGMMVDPTMFITYAWPIFVVTFIVIAGKVVFSIFGFSISGQPFKTSMLSSFSLAQVGEFAFIIASLGMSIGVLNPRVYPIIVAVSVITTFLTPVMIKSAEPFVKFIKKYMPTKWVDYVDQNRTIPQVSKSEERLWQALFKSYFTRLILFSMILSAIIGISALYVRPFMYEHVDGIPGRIAVTTIVFLLMSPFLKALIGWEGIIPNFFRKTANLVMCGFRVPKEHEEKVKEKSAVAVEADSQEEKENKFQQLYHIVTDNTESMKDFFISNHQVAKIYHQLWKAKKSNRLPLMVLTSFRLLIVSFFIVTTVHQFLTENSKVTFILLVASILLLSRSKWLLEQYMKIEIQFLSNLKGSLRKEEHSDEAKEKGKKEEEKVTKKDVKENKEAS